MGKLWINTNYNDQIFLLTMVSFRKKRTMDERLGSLREIKIDRGLKTNEKTNEIDGK